MELLDCLLLEILVGETTPSQVVSGCRNFQHAAKQYSFGSMCANVRIPDAFEIAVWRTYDPNGIDAASLQVQLAQERCQCIGRHLFDSILKGPDSRLYIAPWQFHHFVVWLTGCRKKRIV
jgi:hypothetical protein